MKLFHDRFAFLRDEAGEGEGGGAGAAAGAGADAAAELQKEVTALKAANAKATKDLETANATLGEKDTAIQYWHGKATKGPAAGGQASVEQPGDDVDLLDVIGTKGTKGLDAVLKARGYVSKDDVQALIAETVQTVSREGKAVERFPELKDTSSEFYKLTIKNVAALKADGITGVKATEIAAERAYLHMVDEGKMDTHAQRKAKADKAGEDEEEAERIARANAAGGDTGRRAATKGKGKGELDAEQKRIIRAMGITEDAYKARADKGVIFSGR